MTRLPAILEKRIAESGPVRVGVIGAGKFSSMFLNQVPFSPHLKVSVPSPDCTVLSAAGPTKTCS